MLSTVPVGTPALPFDFADLGIFSLALLVAVVLVTVVMRPKGRAPRLPEPLRGDVAALEAGDGVPGVGVRGVGVPEVDHSDGRVAVVVVQPVKYPEGSRARRDIATACSDLGWAEPEWIETSEEDPGVGQAREAVQRRPDVVLVLGGDGTVRAVAEGLAGTGMPLGLLPGGTGNLFARQLKVELGDIGGATRDALAGRDKAVDVGRVTIDDGDEQVFLVMAGLGFDAEMMAGAPAAIKDRVGPLAYIVSGLGRLRGESSRVALSFDGGPPVSRRVRMAVVGNCGTLIGGIVLIPDAEVDDGHLDVLTLSPSGVLGWLRVGVQLLLRRRGGRMDEHRVTSVTITSAQPQQAQMDGDPIGDVHRMQMRVDPGALVVRTVDGGVPHRPQHLADVIGR